MADEMGLGKTLQCIALLWTLLKQSPRACKPTIEKSIIVCPSSLVRNWANEFSACRFSSLGSRVMPHIARTSAKWLGKDTVPSLALDGKGTKAEMIHKVQRWAAASGRNVTLPGLLLMHPRPHHSHFTSSDCILRDVAHPSTVLGERRSRIATLR